LPARPCCATSGPTSPAAHAPARRRVQKLKLDIGVTRREVATDCRAGPDRSRVPGIRAGARGAAPRLRRPCRPIASIVEARPSLLRRWRERCRISSSTKPRRRPLQLRLALLLAAPANRIFLVGDDDQTIYGWRLADFAFWPWRSLLPRRTITVNIPCSSRPTAAGCLLPQRGGRRRRSRRAMSGRTGSAASRTASSGIGNSGAAAACCSRGPGCAMACTLCRPVSAHSPWRQGRLRYGVDLFSWRQIEPTANQWHCSSPTTWWPAHRTTAGPGSAAGSAPRMAAGAPLTLDAPPTSL